MKPSILKGTRDFSPRQVFQRNYIFDTIRKVFIKYGYQPIETPTMENLATLTGKYGEEGDKLLFKVLNNGDYLAKADASALAEKNSAKLTSSIAKRGLRYDLTVPFARYVVMHQNDIAFPFKRYQIQPVWRADRPQKGRYQEFYQCDVDVVGSTSLVYEAELIQIYDEVFSNLGLKVVIRVNNRKILAGIAEVAGISDRFIDLTTAIDKLDKIGMEGVQEELRKRSIPESAIEKINAFLQLESIDDLAGQFDNSEVGQQGVTELQTAFNYLSSWKADNTVKFDITLARGLGYYTGCIFEVIVDTSIPEQSAVKMGSIGGGGRYDDLTSIFGLSNVSGVGISFGADRIFDVLEELNLYPEDQLTSLKVLFMAFDQASHDYAFKCLTTVRQANINGELYPDPVKLKKQMKYANTRKVPFVVLIGTNEMESGQLTLKNMETGEQEALSLAAIMEKLQ